MYKALLPLLLYYFHGRRTNTWTTDCREEKSVPGAVQTLPRDYPAPHLSQLIETS